MLETAYHGWMIACFQEMHRISRHFGADFDEVVDVLEDIHRVRFDRPIMFPDVIGGHYSLVEAESVVTKDVQLGHLVAGNPARVIKKVEEIKYPLGFYKLGEVYSWRKK